MPGCSEYYKDEGDEINKCDAVPNACQRQQATIEFERFNLGTCSIKGYESCNGHTAHADEKEETSPADN
jgi:hypothetical protein